MLVMNAETFNRLYPVGTPVFAYPGCRPEDDPKDTRLVTRTRSKASIFGDVAVVMVDGYERISLSHVDVVSEGEWEAARAAETAAPALPVPVGDQPQPLDDQRLAEALTAYEGHPDLGFACCTAHAVADHVPALLAEVQRLKARVAADRAGVLVEVTTWLVKKAREFRATGQTVQGDTASVLASKIERGAIRANNLRMLPADFFEPGHTYTHVDDGTDWKFRVDTVTTHPDDGERTALGWRHFRGEWEPYAYGEDDYDVHLHAGLADTTLTNAEETS